MTDLNKRIGENLTRYRGDMSQAQLASAMKERGHKWSQATVWSIEKGDRALRLAEAQDVTDILNDEQGRGLTPDLLLRGGRERDLSEANRRFLAVMEEFDQFVDKMLEAYHDLAHTVLLASHEPPNPALNQLLWPATTNLEEHHPVRQLLNKLRAEELREDAGVDWFFWEEFAKSGAESLSEYLEERDRQYQERGFEGYADWMRSVTSTDRDMLLMRLRALDSEDSDGEH